MVHKEPGGPANGYTGVALPHAATRITDPAATEV